MHVVIEGGVAIILKSMMALYRAKPDFSAAIDQLAGFRIGIFLWSAFGKADNMLFVQPMKRSLFRPKLSLSNTLLEPNFPLSMITFAIAAFILAITPGPGLAYVIAKTVSSGRTAGLASCIGTAIGGLVHVLAAAFGLSLVIAKSAVAFNAIRFVGAAYLVFLGIRLLMRKPETTQVCDVAAQGFRHAMIEGVVVEAMNVKTALFFLAFLPQFISPASDMTGQLALLGSICVALNTLVDIFAVFTAERLLVSESLRVARAQLLTRISGVTMICLGVFLCLE